jgi:hypothetical protein
MGFNSGLKVLILSIVSGQMSCTGENISVEFQKRTENWKRRAFDNIHFQVAGYWISV